MTAFQLDSTTTIVADAGVGAQFVNASPQWDFFSSAAVPADAGNAGTAAGYWVAGETVPEAGADAEAGSPEPTFTFAPINCSASGCAGAFGTLAPSTLATIALPLNVPNAGFGTAIANATGAPPILQVPPGCTPGATCLSPFIYPMPEIDEFSNGSTVGPSGCTPGVNCTVTTPAGGSYADGKGYVFILVGDPTQPPTSGGAPNLNSAHFLAFPTSNP
jgi:hypothetical protein